MPVHVLSISVLVINYESKPRRCKKRSRNHPMRQKHLLYFLSINRGLPTFFVCISFHRQPLIKIQHIQKLRLNFIKKCIYWKECNFLKIGTCIFLKTVSERNILAKWILYIIRLNRFRNLQVEIWYLNDISDY